jgi:hypothetical protein
MTSIPTYTPARPYTNTLTDSRGDAWQFAYWGSGFVFVRPVGDDIHVVAGIGNSSRDIWPFLISLTDYMMRPEGATGAWLTKRAHAWIDARNEDIDAGNID